MKKAIEYMKHKTDSGVVDPEWVDSGGFFPNATNKTFVGIVKSLNDRDYFIPDSIVYLDNKFAVQRRQLLIDHPDGKASNDYLTELSNTITTWWNENIL
jgi:hypothetical protein